MAPDSAVAGHDLIQLVVMRGLDRVSIMFARSLQSAWTGG
jgi:hypothetical protein